VEREPSSRSVVLPLVCLGGSDGSDKAKDIEAEDIEERVKARGVRDAPAQARHIEERQWQEGDQQETGDRYRPV
jgi:hypothetical protein